MGAQGEERASKFIALLIQNMVARKKSPTSIIKKEALSNCFDEIILISLSRKI